MAIIEIRGMNRSQNPVLTANEAVARTAKVIISGARLNGGRESETTVLCLPQVEQTENSSESGNYSNCAPRYHSRGGARSRSEVKVMLREISKYSYDDILYDASDMLPAK